MPAPRILAWITTGNGYCRELVRGVFRCAHHRSWVVDHIAPRGGATSLPELRGCIGAIALDPPLGLAAALRAAGLPLVDISNSREAPGSVRIASDDHAAGRLAAEHLLGLGHRAFAAVGLADSLYSRLRLAGFAQRLRVAGHQPAERILYRSAAGRSHVEETRAWLAALPRPCALFACADQEALFIHRLAEDAGLRIPDDLAILGVDDDDLACGLADPPLSSVRLDPRGNGYAAGEALAQLIAGARVPAVVRVPPLGVTVRGSTDARPVQDPVVRAAMAWLRGNALSRPSVRACAAAVGVAPRTLQARFAAHLGHGPAEALRRLRLEHARRMMTESDLPLRAIAARCRFSTPAAFSTAFRQEFRISPRAWRAAAATGGGDRPGR